MSFPLSACGSFELNVKSPSDVQKVLSGLASAIDSQKPFHLKCGVDEIWFRGGVFRFVSSLNQLAPITSGNIKLLPAVRTLRIEYKISFVELFIISLVLVIIGFGVIPNRSITKTHLEMILSLLPLWAWLFGCSYCVARFRFPGFLRRAAENALIDQDIEITPPSDPTLLG